METSGSLVEIGANRCFGGRLLNRLEGITPQAGYTF